MAECDTASTIRVVIVARRHFDGDALAALCRAYGDFCVLCTTVSVESASLVCAHRRPDVVLLDAAILNSENGCTIPSILAQFGDTPVLILDDDVNRARLAAILDMPRIGYTTRLVPCDIVAEAIRRLARGEREFEPAVSQHLQRTPQGWKLRHDTTHSLLARLTRRETDVLRLIAAGRTVKDCAVELGLSPSTVDNHKSRMMKKLGVHRAIDLTRLAVREGLVGL